MMTSALSQMYGFCAASALGGVVGLHRHLGDLDTKGLLNCPKYGLLGNGASFCVRIASFGCLDNR